MSTPDDLDPDYSFDDVPDLGPIPRSLHSSYSDAPFLHCTVCSRALVENGIYQIQKVFRGQECILELAVCRGCSETIASEYSEESKEAIWNFREKWLMTEDGETCSFCERPRLEFESYTLAAICRKESLLIEVQFMCEKCEEELQEKLSQKTRDLHDEFIRDHFPGMPNTLDLQPTLSGL